MSREPSSRTLFSGPFVDRRAELRDDPDWAAAARADADTRYLIATGAEQLMLAGSAPDILLLANDDALVREAEESSLTLLGWFRGQRTVLVEWRREVLAGAIPAGAELRELRALAPMLEDDTAALLAYARALVLWRSRHQHCGVCGSPNRPARAGHLMRCTRDDCGHETFPRLDPAVIVLIADRTGERALLGRQAAWPPGRYSTIAGFVEPGESLEDAVVREADEEAGVQVAEVRYVASQPWPFPSSLMLGFRAVARTEAISLKDGELEDARWFTRADLDSGQATLPPRGSISSRLIDDWYRAGP